MARLPVASPAVPRCPRSIAQGARYKSAMLSHRLRVTGELRRGWRWSLRYDWPKALREAGFDATAPTAWLAKGLLMYLPADGQDRLFEQITELIAAGSRIEVAALAPAEDRREEMREQFQNIREARHRRRPRYPGTGVQRPGSLRCHGLARRLRLAFDATSTPATSCVGSAASWSWNTPTTTRSPRSSSPRRRGNHTLAAADRFPRATAPVRRQARRVFVRSMDARWLFWEPTGWLGLGLPRSGRAPTMNSE